MDGSSDKRHSPDENSTTSNNAGGTSSSLPSSLLPHLYTGPSIARASRDSGTRTTLIPGRERENSDDDEECQGSEYDQERLPSGMQSSGSSEIQHGSGFGAEGVRSGAGAPAMSLTTPSTSLSPLQHFLNRQPATSSSFSTAALGLPSASLTSSTSISDPPPPSSSSSSSSQFSSFSQQPRTQISTNESYATMLSSSVGSSAVIRPIRSDPAYHAQISGSGYLSYQTSHHLPISALQLHPDLSSYSRQPFESSSSSLSPYRGQQSYPVLPPLEPFRREPLQPGPSSSSSTSGYDLESRAIGRRRKKKAIDEDGSGLNDRSLGLESSSTTSGILTRIAMPSGTYSREVGPPQSKVAKKVLIACDFCRGRKLRCDGARPACSNCSTREGQTCNYQVLVRRRGPGKAKKGSKAKQGKGITGPGTEGVSIMDSQGTQQVTQQIFRFKTPIQPPVASSENSLLFAGVSGPSPRSRRSPPEESDYLNPELQHRLALHHQRVPTTPGITVAHRQQQPFQNQPHFQAASNVRPHFYPSHPHPQPSSFQQMAYSTGMATNRAGPSSSWPGRGSTAPLTIKSEPESAGFDWTGTSGRPLSQHIASDSLPPEERQIMHPPTELGGGSQPYTSEHYYPSGSGYRYYDDRDPNREEEEGRYQWYYGSRDERSRSPGGMRRIDVENGSLRSS